MAIVWVTFYFSNLIESFVPFVNFHIANFRGHAACRFNAFGGLTVISFRPEIPRCPVDGEEIPQDECFRDKCCEREVLSLLCYCRWKERGCEWKGELKVFERVFLDFVSKVARSCKFGQRHKLFLSLSMSCFMLMIKLRGKTNKQRKKKASCCIHFFNLKKYQR